MPPRKKQTDGAAPEDSIVLSARVDAALLKKIEAARTKSGVTQSDFFRQALVAASTPTISKKPNSDPKERLLQELRKCGGVYLASERAKVDPKQVEAWCKDAAFSERIITVQRAWLEERQEELVQLGVGQRKGQVIALLGVLNSLHPDYGRAKAETINRALKALMGDLATILQEELGGGNQAALNRALDRFEQSKENRLAHLT